MSSNFEISGDKSKIDHKEYYPNCELVQRGFRILHPRLLDYICKEFRNEYHDGWRQEILRTLNDQETYFLTGCSEKDLRDFLDIANCLRLFKRKWSKIFRKRLLQTKALDKYNIWAKELEKTYILAEELKAIRNETAHIGGNDFNDDDTWRALDTMFRFCGAFDPESASRIRELCCCLSNPAPASAQPQQAQPIPASPSEKKPVLKGTVVIQKESYDQEHDTLTLRAVFDMAGMDAEQSDIAYHWEFAWRKGGAFNPLPNTGSRIQLASKGNFGKIYRCEVTCAGYADQLSGEYGPLTKADLDAPLKQQAAIPALQEKPDAGKTPGFYCFDSQVNWLHYFAAPRSDYYATNGLEYVDYNAFLYILLKEEGYRRVVIVGSVSGNEDSKYPVITYDSFAQLSFLHPIRFKDFFQSGKETCREVFLNFCESCQSAFTYGKTVIHTIDRTQESFETFMKEKVSVALQSNILKTAIVLPLELLRENDCLTMESIRNFGINTNVLSGNIMLITADRTEDFNCLPSSGRLLTAADTPGRDEIANFLFRQKLEQPERFRLLPWSKISSLAEFILEKCSSPSGTSQALRGLPDNTWYVGPLRNLEKALQNDQVLDTLIKTISFLPNKPDGTALAADSRRETELERIRGWQSGKKSSSFGLLTRRAIAGLPDPYVGIDIHGASFPDHCTQSVVRIKTEYGSASAFIISPDGYALTCAHAVSKKQDFTKLAEKKRDAYCKYIGRHPLPFIIKNIRPDLDMALIKIEAGQLLPYLRLAGETRRIHLGEECCLYGYPEGREGIMRFPVTISSQAEQGQGGELGNIYYFSGDAEPGDSGGPVIAKSDGLVIGILRGAQGESNKFNYLKPVSYFWMEFLN